MTFSLSGANGDDAITVNDGVALRNVPARSGAEMRARRSIRSESGFTIVEVMVAALILVIAAAA